MLPVNVRGMWIGTFHGLCNRFLRAHYKLANLPQSFQILDTQDQLSAIKRLMKQHNVDDERFPAKETQWFIAGCKEEGLRAEHGGGAHRGRPPQGRDLPAVRRAVPARGRGRLRRADAAQLRAAARQRPDPRALPAALPPHPDRRVPGHQQAAVRLDQDVRRAHGEARCSRWATTTRASTPSAARAWATWPTSCASSACAHQIKLEQNYRSFSNILDSANALIAHNKTRLGKNLRTDQGPGEPVRVYEAPTDLAEAQWMVEEIRHLVRGDGPRRSARNEIAVLYRSNAQSRVIETALFNAAVPYRVYGGLRFFERAEIKHALAYLRLLENPQRRHQLPARGELPAARHRRAQRRAAAGRRARRRLLAARRGAAPPPARPAPTSAAFVAEDRRACASETAGPDAARDHRGDAAAQSGLIDHYKAERDGADRIENLEELVNAAESFVTQEGFGRDAVACRSTNSAPRCCASRRPARGWTRACRRSTSRRPTTCRPMRRPARRCRRWPPSSRTPRWSPATTRPRPARTRCS